MIELKNRKIKRMNGIQHYLPVPKHLMDTELLSIDEIYTVKFILQKKK